MEKRLPTPSGASETPDITGRFQNIPEDPHASAVATVPDKQQQQRNEQTKELQQAAMYKTSDNLISPTVDPLKNINMNGY